MRVKVKQGHSITERGTRHHQGAATFANTGIKGLSDSCEVDYDLQ